MKKTLLLGLLVAAGFGANAQLTSGSQAPDFTATDINGNVHHLQEYLDAGKTVIIDISATWCGPCWNYHGTRALSDIYEAYGPGGSDEVVVLFIEGDPSTSVQSIYGTNTASDDSVTRGDWTQHSPYPIIDDGTGAISNAYDIAYFPTIYMICPSGILKELQQPSASTLKAQISGNSTNACGMTLTGVQDKARPDVTAATYCEAEGAYSAKIKNLGANKVLSATVELKENGTTLSTKTYSNANGISTFGSTTINFDSVTFTEGAEHTVEITNINGLTELPFPGVATEETSITPNNAVEVANNITVEIHTDFYPSEATWQIRKVDGNTLVASGGPYQAGTADQYGGGGPDANTTKTTQVTLAEGIECYKVVLADSFGDGWIYGPTGQYDPTEFHGIKLLNGEEVVYEKSVSTFTFSTLTYDAAIISNGTLGANQPVAATKTTVFPNPTKGILYIATPESVDLTVTDMTGKVVFSANTLQNGSAVNLSSLQKGMYIATLKGAAGQKTEKVIID